MRRVGYILQFTWHPERSRLFHTDERIHRLIVAEMHHMSQEIMYVLLRHIIPPQFLDKIYQNLATFRVLVILQNFSSRKPTNDIC